MPKPAESSSSDRAPLSSPLAIIAAVAIAAFTYTAAREIREPHWSVTLVVLWSYALAGALLIWSCRDWFNIHWIGNPTISMVAGASGAALAAVALVFTYAGSRDQDAKLEKALKIMERQAEQLEKVNLQLKTLNENIGRLSSRPEAAISAKK